MVAGRLANSLRQRARRPQSDRRVRRRSRCRAVCRSLDRFRRIPGVVAGRPQHRSEEHTCELQSRFDLVCRLLLEKKKKKNKLYLIKKKKKQKDKRKKQQNTK